MVQYFAKVFDQVIVLPVYEHMLGSKRGRLAPFEDRLAMSKLCFASLEVEGVSVSTVERDLATREHVAVVNTYNVLLELRKQDEDADFVLILGTDTFADLLGGKWTDTESLMTTFKLAVVLREGYVLNPEDAKFDRKLATVEEHVIKGLGEVSSTAARLACAEERWDDAAALMCPGVVDYVRAHKLYGGSTSAPACELKEDAKS